MDWYLAGDDPADVTALRHRIRDHLLRHAAPGTDVSDAELVVQELLANAFEHAARARLGAPDVGRRPAAPGGA